REVFTMVVRDGMRPVIAGGIIGVVGAIASSVVIKTLLFGVAPIDPATYGVALTTLGAVALAAGAMPARRATRVDPLAALREESSGSSLRLLYSPGNPPASSGWLHRESARAASSTAMSKGVPRLRH